MRRAAPLLALALAAGGCATVPTGAAKVPSPVDPWEAWNRNVFAFNDSVDRAVLKPVATAYRDVVPSMVRTGVDNFLSNLGDVWSAANHLLQGKAQSGLEMGMRVLVNTTFGLGGLLDPASEMKLDRRSEDFGQTLGRWGLGDGPYIVLPLLGPSNLRDTTALPFDRAADLPARLPATDAGRYWVVGLELLNARAKLLDTTRLVDDVALDRYIFVRDAYLSRRRDQVYDGAAPLEDFDDEAADPPKK